ncbi:universal stress protein [Actinophytocola sp.]|uniref:universal stress protein n=1 Tax=Actinophytocola sp. TaxID=1872138 RepID=UPI002D7EB9C6|nr:universal stress protein [Actinophytocola sp.]HET9142283.1 universal stress protein [Actinophytocola sp.]
MTDNNGTRPIVVGVDGSAVAEAALRWATDEAARRGSPLKVVTIATRPRLAYTVPAQPDWVERAAGQARKAAAANPTVHIRQLRVAGTPGRALIDAADGAAMLVVGSRGAGPIARALLGSVGTYCANHARCPVVIVPAPRSAAEPTRIHLGRIKARLEVAR